MFFDALTMACVADELRNTVLGGRVQKVLVPDRLSVGLEIYSGGQRHYLVASAHATWGRVHLTSDRLRRGVDRETGLLLLLRKYARGACLASIDQPPFERILRLELDHPEWGCTELVVEVMGRHSNVILVGPGPTVLDAVKRVGPQMSSVRPILPGRAYVVPPPQAKLPPDELTEYRLRQILAAAEPGAQLWRALVSGLRGMSPLLAREIAFRTLGQPRARVDQVARLTPILETVHSLLSPLESGQWQPCIVLEGEQPAAYAPYRLTHRGEATSVGSMSEAIERATQAAATGPSPYAAAKRPMEEAIASARGRLRRRRDALERSLRKAEEADHWRSCGEWILAYAHTIQAGQTALVADTGAGEPLQIQLDRQLSAADNAQAYFARYRKGQRAAAGGPSRLAKVDLALRDVEQLETDLQLAASRPEIDAVRAALIEAGHLRAKKGKAPKSGLGQPLTLIPPDGLTILVGRNSRQNDEVTFRRAGGGDWWFHARGVPGAHVIVRAVGRPLPPDTIQRAAELAAFFSRSQKESSVVVDYTLRRHVRRIRGAAPGLVTYAKEQTVRVSPRGPDLD